MATLTPTKDTGATTKEAPMIYAEIDRIVDDATLARPFEGSGLNGAFVADTLSAMLTHERCGVHLYRSAEARANNPILQAKYRQFGGQTLEHVEILEGLITQLGGNPSYVSPMARAVEATNSKNLEATFLGSGSLDPMTAETAILDAVFLAETIDHSNWRMLAALSRELPAGPMQDAFDEAVSRVEEQEDEHLEWAQSTRERLMSLQAKSDAFASAGMKAEELVSRVRNWLAT